MIRQRCLRDVIPCDCIERRHASLARTVLGLLLFCVPLLAGPPEGGIDAWLRQVRDAPDAATRQALLDDALTWPDADAAMRLALEAEAKQATDDGWQMIRGAMAIAEKLGQERPLAFVTMLRGHITYTRGDMAEAEADFAAAAKAYLAIKWRDAVWSCLAWSAVCAERLGDHAQAKERYTATLSSGSQDAVDLQAGAPDPGLEHLRGWACLLRARIEEDSQRWPTAEMFFRRAADAFREAGGPDGPLAGSLDRAGLIAYYQSKLDDAEACYRESLAVAQRSGSPFRLGRANLGLAEIRLDQSKFDEVLQYLDVAIPQFEQAESWTNLGRAYYDRATVKMNQGNHQEVEAELVKAEEAYEKADWDGGLADCKFVRATTWQVLGDRARALAAFAEAKAIYVQRDDLLGQANVELKESQAARQIGYLDQAQAMAAGALEKYRRIGDRIGEANSLRALGRLARHQGRLDEAETLLREALAIYERIGDPLGKAATMWQIGVLMREQEAAAEPTIKMLLDCMELYQQIGDIHGAALPAIELGRYCAWYGDGQLALKAFLRALDYGEHSGSRMTVASALYHLGLLCENLAEPDLKAAETFYRNALDVVDEMRVRAGGQEDQQAVLGSYMDYYDALIRVLLKAGEPKAAFDVAERAHARTLLDMVVDAGVDLSAGLSLAQRSQEAQLSARLTLANVALGRLLAATEPPAEQVTAARDELQAARRALAEYRDGLYSVHPDLSRRRSADPRGADDLAAALPPHTAVLAYRVGEQASAAFVLHAVDGRAAVEAVQLPLGALEVWELVDTFREACANPRRRWTKAGADLREAVFDPIAAKLPAGTRHLVIIPDGALFEAPFDALPDQNGVLWEQYTISYAASGSLLLAARQTQHQAPRELLTFANPVFGDLVRTFDLERGGSALAELPGTAAEAAALVAQFGAQATVLSREAASEEAAKAQLGDYRMIHFATHGILDSANPLYSSVVLSAPGPDSKEDGQLEAREIMDLQLHADLVTLSACETGRGKVQPGEGLLGLAWALTAAGAKGLVVSQWKVSDDATKELMASFYRNLAAGQDKASALRAAALELRGTQSHPYYWAPFLMMGSW